MGRLIERRSSLSALLVLALVLGAGPAWAQDSPEPADATEPRVAETEVFGFLPYWELDNAEGIDLDTVTTLAWFGLEAGEDGRLIREGTGGGPTPGWAGWTSQAFDELLARSQARGVRVVLTVERFAWDEAGRNVTKALLRDPAARAMLVDDIVEVVTSRGVGGVNLDLEPLPKAVRSRFVRLVRELREGLDAVDPSLQLTVDVTPDVESYPLPRLLADGAADAAVLMGYEYRTAGSRVAGSVAPLKADGPDLRDTVRSALAVAPADQLVLALPWYGRAWSTRSDGKGARTRRSDDFIAPATALYRSALPRAAVAGRRFDGVQASAWSVYQAQACDECPLTVRQLWYDDVDSVKAKVGLALRKGLRGVGIWALGYEGANPELWSAMRYALERPRDDTPPGGTVALSPGSVIETQDGLPVVGKTVTLDLTASDGVGGTGVALVRVSAGGRVSDGGMLKSGTTFPAVESVRVSMPHARPVDEVFFAGGASLPAEPSPELSPDPTLAPEAATPEVPVTLRVQWRDVAGNWSVPTELHVLFAH